MQVQTCATSRKGFAANNIVILVVATYGDGEPTECHGATGVG